MRSQRLDAEIKRIHDEAIRPKREQWQRVQAESPEIANFMIDINKAFGKPAAVKVELNSGEVILESGVFQKQHPKLPREKS